MKNNTKTPLISVITPVYNVEKYLPKCLDSVINQTLENIEIILVDDGSVDGSPQICDEYAKKDKRIKVIHQPNGKQANARNNGIKRAEGEYIAFIDSDDWIEKKFLETLYEQAKQNNADMAVGNVKVVPSKIFNYVGHWSFSSDKNILTTPQDKIGCIYSCAIWNKIYKRVFLEQKHISFNEKIFLEDVTFNQIACILANKIVLCPDMFYFYNIENQTSFMKTAHKTKKVMSMLDMTQEAKKFLKDKCDNEYFQILDSFEIYNLWGWFKAIDKESIKRTFFKKMTKLFQKIDVKNNSLILPDSKKIYEAVIKTNDYDVIMFSNKTYFVLYGLIKIITYENKIWKIYLLNIPLATRKPNKFYLLGIPLVKIKSVNNIIGNL